jgi:hypothetical protein
MTVRVADVRANLNENIRHAARIIGRSKQRRDVFAAIYRGKKSVKTVDDVVRATGLPRMRVLQEAGKLAGNEIIDQVKVGGRVAYKKYPIFSHHKAAVLDLVDHPNKKTQYPTKQEPRAQGATTHQITVTLSRSQPFPQSVTIDEIDTFSAVQHVAARPSKVLSGVPEARINRFLRHVIGEARDFKDWGGEKNDLFTNKLRFRGSRRTAAFAIKGRATRGPLTPKKMGKNGDQLGRLFSSDAQLFFVVYHSKVDEAIHAQMRVYALGRALGGGRVYYCVVDGDDLGRLIEAYPTEFAASARVT